ncbi:MAG: hypothetical protein QOD66_976 [Solirubrobacteraceae bacterium]|jgi:hypothetical protein|nr:hypothetical protein [Solirubrobacteraceae bacterium]
MSSGATGASAVALRAALAEGGGTLSQVLVAETELAALGGSPAAPQVAAAGPRARGHEVQYELLLEMIREGSLLHYGRPRMVRPADPDLALLLGDQLYALGLTRLAALGDLDAVGELGDTISLLAQAQAAGDLELAEAVWDAGAVAIGWGATEELEAAKVLARMGDPLAAKALRAAALAGPREERGS